MPIDVTTAEFKARIVDASLNVPILVDFWAPWCQPCLAAAPMLEKLERESAGRWVLAKINVDENQELAAAMNIRSIPNLKLVYQGALIGELAGALPEVQMRQWLEQHLPEAAPTEEENEAELTKEGIRLAQAEGDLAGALRLAESYHAENPTDEEGLALLALLMARENPDMARVLLAKIDAGSPYSLVAQSGNRILEMMQEVQDGTVLPEGPVQTTYRAALEAFMANDFAAALERFIEVIIRDKAYNEEGARKSCLAIFHLLSPQNPITLQFRKRFDMALY